MGLRPPPRGDGWVWTQRELDLLGTLPEAELAARIGRTANAVRIMPTRPLEPVPAGPALDGQLDPSTRHAIMELPGADPTGHVGGGRFLAVPTDGLGLPALGLSAWGLLGGR